MSTTQLLILVGVTIAGFAGLAGLLWRRTGERTWESLQKTLGQGQNELEERLGRGQTYMLSRLEQLKGELQTDFTERLQGSSQALREAVERQLADGRFEQSRRLSDAVLGLENRFDSLRTATENRLEQVAQGQAESARQARSELAKNLAESTHALQQRVEALEQRTAGHLEKIQTNVESRLQTLGDQVQTKLEKNIQEGFAHFQKVQEHLRAAEEQLRNVGVVGQSINELNTLLKLPHLRGRFGEAELGRLLADFLPASAYEEQFLIVPGSREAVDAVVRFPKYLLPIDSKFNREQVLPLFESTDPTQLAEARKQLSSAIRQQARSISEKYIHVEHGTTDLALMFLPSETLYFEVIRNPELCEALHKLKVFPVSPNTLAITLRSISMSISQYEFARNVESTLVEIRRAHVSFSRFQKRFDDVGRGLDRAQEAYQTATGHLSRYANRVIRLTGEPEPDLLSDPKADGEPTPEETPGN
ncbi:MAG: DNA recombination protein RmuC [Verrucomicrobiae bacterium]|nr:DNA recombination protein RmuC [Verrucomicrobiae bacterium]MCP5523553.1 DNA recombination protein RmuC [Verrucomicrobiales bacterium]